MEDPLQRTKAEILEQEIAKQEQKFGEVDPEEEKIPQPQIK
jgi:hypothetical protein